VESIDAIAPFILMKEINKIRYIWAAEGVCVIFGAIGLWGIRYLRPKFNLIDIK